MNEPVSPPRSRLRSRIQALCLLAVSVGFALLLGEAAVRIFRPQYLRPVFRERVDGMFYLRPNLHTRIFSPGEFDTRATTTNQRFRGQTLYDSIPPAGTFRVATIGDSFTFGTGANDDEAFPEELERVLARSGRFGKVEVLNAGIPNAGPGDEALWYDHWVKHFHPDLVVLTIYGGNDISDEVHDSKFELNGDRTAVPLDSAALNKHGLEAWLQQAVLKIPGYDFLTEHSQLLYAVRSTLTGMFSAPERERLAAAADDSLNRLAIGKILAEIRWLAQRAEAAGSRLVVVFIPSRDEFIGSARKPEVLAAESLEEQLRLEAATDSIPFLDFGKIIPDRVGARGASLYFQRDDHMRPEGYKLIGDEVANLLTGSFSPPESLPSKPNPSAASHRSGS